MDVVETDFIIITYNQVEINKEIYAEYLQWYLC